MKKSYVRYGIVMIVMWMLLMTMNFRSSMAYAWEFPGQQVGSQDIQEDAPEQTTYELMIFCDLPDVVQVDSYFYAPGEIVTLRAVLPPGYSTPEWIYPGFEGNETVADEISFVMPESNAVVFCYPQAIQYPITYELNGGVLEGAEEEPDIKGNPDYYTVAWTDVTLNNPVKEGHIFLGWTGSCGDTPQMQVTIPSGSMGERYYEAQWEALVEEPATYTVHTWLQDLDGDPTLLDSDNYSLVESREYLANPGMELQVMPGVLTGCSALEPDGQSITVAADGSTEVAFYYTRKEYRVSVEVEEYQASWSGDGTYLYGAPVRVDVTYRPGYRNGTYVLIPSQKHESKREYVSFHMPAYDLTVFVCPALEVYQITYTDADGVDNPTEYTVETSDIVLQSPVREGYDFIGWTGTNGDIPQRQVSIPQGSTGDRQYTAHWRKCELLGYTDLDLGEWYHDALDYVVSKGWMHGISDTEFAPMDTLDRASMVTVLYRISGAGETASPEEKAQWLADVRHLEDVISGAWYEEAVAWAVASGVTNGTSATTFEPDRSIDRQQFVVMLYKYFTRYAGGLGGQGADLSSFVDGSAVSDWAMEGVQWAVSAGLLTGKPAGDKLALDPQGETTRVEAAALLQRFDLWMEAGPVHWIDTEEGLWIDRIAALPQSIRRLYDTLVEGADGDGYADVLMGDYDYPYIVIAQIYGTIEYGFDWAAEMDRELARYQPYVQAAYQAFLKDHPEVCWLKPECICDIGMEFGGDGYLFTVYLLLADDGSGYDIRLDEYIND